MKPLLAWMLALRGTRNGDALEFIQEAVQLEVERLDLIDTRALSHLAGGRADHSIRDLEAAAVRPDPGEMLFHLAKAHRMAGRGDEAATVLRRALERGQTVDDIQPRSVTRTWRSTNR